MGNSRQARGYLPLAAAVALSATVLAGCGSGGAGGGAAAGTGDTVTIRANEFAYQPAQIKMVAPGDLTIKIDNKGMVEHDFMIEGVPGKLLVKANQTGTQTFKIAKAGTYTFACTVSGHRDAGMKGTLTVG